MPWINSHSWSTPFYSVRADQSTVPVILDTPSGSHMDLRAAWARVPLPADARPADGTDAGLVVYQPATDTMWEFWRLSRQLGTWHAVWGGRMSGVSTNPGYYSDPSSWGSTATSLPKIGGTIMLDELRAGHIDHALALGIPQPRARVFSWPARRTDGTLDSPTAIPEGTRFRLDPNLDVDTLGLPPLVRMIAHAAQTYGMVVRDRSGDVSLYAQDPTPTGTDPFYGPGGYFTHQNPAQQMRLFPWDHLQALPTRLRQ
jgi:hypothetical protein